MGITVPIVALANVGGTAAAVGQPLAALASRWWPAMFDQPLFDQPLFDRPCCSSTMFDQPLVAVGGRFSSSM